MFHTGRGYGIVYGNVYSRGMHVIQNNIFIALKKCNLELIISKSLI